MGIKQVFQDALKKVTASKDQGALEHARSDAGLGVSADTDAFEPLPQPGGTPGGASGPIPNLATGPGTKVPIDRPTVGGTQSPDGPSAPTEPPPGGGGGTTTPPSAPFDPNKVIFKEAPAGGTGTGDATTPVVRPAVRDILTSSQGPPVEADTKLNTGGVNPIVVSRDRAPGARTDDATDDAAGGDEDGGLSRTTPNTSFGSNMSQGTRTVASSDPEEGGEFAARNIGNVKYEDIKVVDGPAGGDEITEIAKGKAQPGDFTFIHVYDKASPVLAREGDEPPGDFKVDGLPVAPIDDGGEVAELRRPPADFKVEGIDAVDDPDAGTEVFRELKLKEGKLELEKQKITDLRGHEDPDAAGDFKVEMEEVLVSPPTAPGPQPIPYPNDAPEPDGGESLGEALKGKADPGKLNFEHLYDKASPVLASAGPADGAEGESLESNVSDSIARKAGEASQEFDPVKLHDGLPSSAKEGVLPDDSAGLDDDGLADALARKAGEGQKDFLKVELKEAFISREAFDGIDGESTNKDHKGEIELARRSEVRDSHDRPTDVGSPEPKPVNALAADDDDDFESDTLLDLRPAPAAKEMLHGLAGEAPGNLDLDGDLDADADNDMDESEL